MGAVYFYHLTRQPVDAVLPMLLRKSLSMGWRIAVRAPTMERLTWLDEKLWLGPEDGFLPHGVVGGEHDADQPILLTTERVAANGASCVMALDGAEIDPAEVDQLDRASILFDGSDPPAVQQARGQWKSLTGAGCAAQYWSQENGPWEMKAERAAGG